MTTLVERYALPPEEIERRSFALIESMLPPLALSPEERHVVVRVVHAAGDPALGPLVRFAPGAVASGVGALRAGCAIYTDVTMVGAGLHQPWLRQLGCEVSCSIHDPEVAARAKEWGTTRAVASMRHLSPVFHKGIVAVGNAPTALLALLDEVDRGAAPPALVVGVPVGFVAASESKEELMKRGLPFVSVPGYRGGSPIAAAILNAMLFLAVQGERGE
jgi:precorrin-8X/cobalt-precorrin-8 methylmutase